MRLLEAHHNLLEGLHRSLLLVVQIEDGEEVVDMDKVVLVVIIVDLLLLVHLLCMVRESIILLLPAHLQCGEAQIATVDLPLMDPLLLVRHP